MRLREIINKEPINKGWSCDKKYCVTTLNGTKYLLRITASDKSAVRKELFEMLKKVEALGIPMCKPVEFGPCNEGVYTLHTWIDGTDAEDTIPPLPEAKQYVLGLKAGEILKQIHSIPAPATQEDWHTRFNRKTDDRIQKYHDCGIRFDFGDPWEEFNRIVWCAQSAPYFATGMIDGYFDKKPPMEFWKCLAFYIGSNTLSAIYWATGFGQSELDVMMKQSQYVLSWYENFRIAEPKWYNNHAK